MRDNWTETTLGEIAEYINGYPFKPEDLGEEGTPVIRIKQLLDPNEACDRTLIEAPDRCVLQSGDIVFSWSGTLAVRVWNRERAYLNQHLFRVVEKEGVLHTWLPFVIEHSIRDLSEMTHGTTMKHVTKQTLLPHAVQLPPLSEQKRIVDLLASVDAYIATLQQQADDARSARNAVLHELLTTGGDNWTETTLGDITEVVGGGTPATSNPAYWDGDIVWLTPTEVVAASGSVLIDSARKITASGLKNSGARLLPEGTVILTSRASVGFSALAGTELATNQGFQSLIPSAQINNKFLMFWIQNNQQEFNSRAAGSTFKEISKANVRSIALALPPLAEQKRIVAIVSALDDVVITTERAVSDTQSLRSGLLSDLLTGEHEIPESYDRLLGAA